MEAVARKLFPAPATPAWHADLDVDGTRIIAEPEVRPQVVLREEAPARTDLADRFPVAATARTATQWCPVACRFSSNVGDPSVLLTTRSRSPSLSRSPTARPRPTAAICRPAPARSDTSRNRVPRFRSSWFFWR